MSVRTGYVLRLQFQPEQSWEGSRVVQGKEDLMASSRKVRIEHRSPKGQTLGHITLTFGLEQYGAQWLGVCQELGTSVHADWPDEAWTDLVKAVLLQLNEMERLGYIEQYLEHNGVKIGPSPAEPGKPWCFAGVLTGAAAR